MCQLNAQQLCEIVESNITSHKGEQKLLTEWREIINNELPKSRRMTPRELAMLFKTFN